MTLLKTLKTLSVACVFGLSLGLVGISSLYYFTSSIDDGNTLILASAAPGPIAGAGLSGVVLASCGLLALARRRRRRIA